MGTSATVNRIVDLCGKSGVAATGYPAVEAQVNPNIREELGLIGSIDTSVFTSPRAAELAYRYSSPTLRANVSSSVVYTIGPSTARMAHTLFGAKPIYPERNYGSHTLSKILGERPLGRVALFSSLKRSQLVVETLRRNSKALYEPRLYDLTVNRNVASMFQRDVSGWPFRGLVFTCSTAALVVRDTQLKRDLTVVAMGQRTRETLATYGYTAILPDDSTVEGVVKLIVSLEQ